MTYILDFAGYWKVRTTDVAAYPGIYCIYVWSPEMTVDSRLLYIGRSKNIESRIVEHMNDEDMLLGLTYHAVHRSPVRYEGSSHELYFSAARITEDRDQVEAAMINHHKPPANTEYVDYFPFPETEVAVRGRAEKLSPIIKVHTYP